MRAFAIRVESRVGASTRRFDRLGPTAAAAAAAAAAAEQRESYYRQHAYMRQQEKQSDEGDAPEGRRERERRRPELMAKNAGRLSSKQDPFAFDSHLCGPWSLFSPRCLVLTARFLTLLFCPVAVPPWNTPKSLHPLLVGG